MPLKNHTKIDIETSSHSSQQTPTQQVEQTPPTTLWHKRSSLLNPFRLRSSSEHLRQRAVTPTTPIPILETVREVREGPILKSSTSAMFIAKMKSELFLSQFKRAQEAYFLSNHPLCIHRCTELLSTRGLHLDTRIETLQLLATIVPLPLAQEHLSDALCLLDLAVERGVQEEQRMALMGLRVTTLEMMGRLCQEMGVERGEGRGSLRRKRSGQKGKTIYQPLVESVDSSMPLRLVRD